MSVDFDAEALWIGEDPANEHRPGVLSQATYGADVAVPLLLELFEQQQVEATFFVSGSDAQRHPERVEQILRAGHEVGHHGHTHRSPSGLTLEQETEELHRGLEVLRGLGAEVQGYRSPSWEVSGHTFRLLEEAGLAYSSNLMDDIRPYRHTRHDLVEVPVHWVLDDAPHYWFDSAAWSKTIRSADEVHGIWREEIDGIRELGGAAVLTIHPFLTGRPGRLPALRRTLEDIRSRDDVWVATAAEVAAWVGDRR